MLTVHADDQSVFDALANQRSAREIDELSSNAGEATLMEQAQRLIAEGKTPTAEVFRVLGHRRTSAPP